MAVLKYFDSLSGLWKLLPPGAKGEKGETGTSTFVRVHHGADANVARPDAIYVEWVGSAQPLNATEEDTWIDTL